LHFNNFTLISNSSTDSSDDEDNLGDTYCIKVDRNEVLKQLLKLYEDKAITRCQLNVQFKGESGIDFGGITMDLFTSFWDAAFYAYFEGDTIKIPFAPPHEQKQRKEVFQILGRILYHGWYLTKQIPTRFCEASFTAMLHGEEAVDDRMLERCFMLYLSQYERELLTKALSSDGLAPHQKDAVFGIYHQYNLPCLPASNHEQLRQHIIIMARSQFVYKPLSTLMWMKNGLDEKQVKSLKEKLPVDKIVQLYEALLPSTEKVLEKLSYCEDLRPEESQALSFLRNFIGSADDHFLDRFLRFTTGSPAAPQRPIRIEFNAAVGIKRLPSSSTCSNTLFLPTTYSSYGEFRREFVAVLNEEVSFEMGLL